jgi:uncharacterized protein YdhG (YjbR/CyaY superfamily)
MTATKPGNIDEALGEVRPEQRTVLEKLRRTIHAAAPGAEECISYGLAAFRWNGRPLVAFGASAKHCAFYPMNSTLIDAHRTELANFDTSKGTIRFQPEAPLSGSLVRKLVKARLAEISGNRLARRTHAPPKAQASRRRSQ